MRPMVGRPKSMDTRKIVSLPAALAQAIEDYRFAHRLKTEAEAIRRLIEAGLQAEKTPLEKGGSTRGGARKPARAEAEPRQRKPSPAHRPVNRQGRPRPCR